MLRLNVCTFFLSACLMSLIVLVMEGTYQIQIRRPARNETSHVTIFCWIVTHPQNHRTKADAVWSTWAQRCDKVLFITDEGDSILPSVALNTSRGRGFLVSKSRTALDYLFQHHLDDADWFLKADDDTYVILENLRRLLRDHDPGKAIFFGNHLQHPSSQDSYVSGGAGYVLSRAALRAFGARETDCPIDRYDGSNEDVRVSECLQEVGVEFGSSLDDEGLHRFHHFTPDTHITGDYPPWFNKRSVVSLKQGLTEMSSRAITFHHLDPEYLYLMEYLVYHMERTN